MPEGISLKDELRMHVAYGWANAVSKETIIYRNLDLQRPYSAANIHNCLRSIPMSHIGFKENISPYSGATSGPTP